MTTLNTRYRNIEKLKEYIKAHNIRDNKRLLIQVFTSFTDKNEIKKLIKFLNDDFSSSIIIGATTDGEIIDSKVLTYNTVISFSQFEITNIDSVLIKNSNYARKIGKTIYDKIVKPDTKVVIIFSTFYGLNPELIIKGLKAEKKDLIVAGSLASDNGEFKNSFVFSNKEITNDGLVAVSLSSDFLKAYNRYNHAWEPIGREFIVTNAQDNIVHEVDNINIKSLYERYLGSELSSKLPLSALQFPFLLKRGSNFLSKIVIDDMKDGALAFNANMKKGNVLQIAFANIDTIIKNAKTIFEEIASKPVESIFIYGSSARRRFLQQSSYYEIEALTEIACVSGFYGYGEYFANEKEINFLGQSLTLLVLSESNRVHNEKSYSFEEPIMTDLNYQTIKALTNIAQISSKELQSLNHKLEIRVKEEVEANRKKDSILIHNSKLAQMGEMMGLIAHQWRQPLSAISATSSGMQIKLELGNWTHDYFNNSLGKIEEYVIHLSRTIDDFTNFFKPTKRKEKVNVNSLIDRALFIMSPSLTKKSVIVKYDNSKDIKLKTYSNEVIQVVLNLLKNAENILFKREVVKPQIFIKTFQKDNKCYIEVSDNGGGISEDIIDKIFEPYFSTKDSEHSTGLGLYMSKFIIEDSCHGVLKVKNTPIGAKFTIILPL